MFTRCRHMDIPFLMRLHVSSEIRVLFMSSCAFGFWIALCMSAKSMSSLVRVVGGWMGSCLSRPRYSVCSPRGVLWSHPRTR